MKNLKRILSLALASVMVMGMMVVGASAADFNDKADIDHVEAVETLVALGIISGKENNNFDPKGTLTRAEMATVIAVIRNRGIAPNFGTKPTPTYSDIDGHWAESYIEYCSSFGIVGGIGGGKFDPEGTLTSTQAARMILNAMGYTISDPSNWALLTEVQAREEGIDLYAGIDDEIADPTNAQITRDQMAQMAYNALNGNMANAEVTSTAYYTLSVKSATLDDAVKTELTNTKFESAADAAAVASSYNLKTDGGAESYTISRKYEDTTEKFGAKYLGTKTTETVIYSVKYDAKNNVYKVNGSSYTVTEDVSRLVGHNVTVLYKGTGDNMKTYGFVDESAELVAATWGDINGTKIAGTDLDSSYKVYRNGAEISNTAGISKAASVKAIDTDGNKKADTLVVTDSTLGTVDYVGSKQITVGGVGAIELEKANVYEGLKKDDLVVVTAADYAVDGKTVVAKAEIMEGTADAYRGSDEVRVNGTWYTVLKGFNTLKAMDSTKTYGLVMLNGYIADVIEGGAGATTGVSDVFMIISAGNTKPVSDYSTTLVQPVRALDASGNTIEMNVAKVGDDAITTDDKLEAADLNKLYTRKANRDGNYELTAVATTGTWNDLTVVTTGEKYNEGKVLDSSDAIVSRISNDAVIFVAGKDIKPQVVTGADANKWVAAAATISGNVLYTTTSSGFTYASMALVTFADGVKNLPGQGSSAGLGWITGDSYIVKVDDADAIQTTIWDGETERTVTMLSVGADGNGTIDATAAKTTYTKGLPITFEDNGNGTLDKVVSLKDKKAAVSALAGNVAKFSTNDVEDSNEYTINDSWTVLYVDTKENKGVEGGAITMARKSELGNWVENVYVDAAQKLLIVDVNNVLGELKALTMKKGTVITEVSGTTITVANGKTVAELKSEVTVLDGYKNCKVLDADGKETTEIANAKTIQITAQDGSLTIWTIAIAAAG